MSGSAASFRADLPHRDLFRAAQKAARFVFRRRLLARHLLRFQAGNAQQRRSSMKREQLTEKLLDIKREKGWTWKYICSEIGGMSPVLITGAVLGQMKMTKPQAAKAAEMFGLSKSEQAMLNEVPHRGSPMPPTDPLIYRLYELVMVNGPAMKVLIEEEFGDGIMSAIDFDMQMERQPDPKGDRVRLSMSGKFLPFKYYGATGNAQQYGFKEE
jgi:cyanate lyase